MIHVAVGDKDVLDLLPGKPGPLQLAQDAVSAAAVHQQVPFVLAQDIARVVTAGRNGVPCAQK